MAKRSLFIVSLPCSLSTHIYRVIRDCLELDGPGWAFNGEVLNHDLLAMSRWPKLLPAAAHFLTEETNPARMTRLRKYLDDVTHTRGRIYKDVVQPFALSSWPGLSRFAVLKIRRDLVEVANSLLMQGWHYPKDALSPDDPLRRSAAMSTAGSFVWSNLVNRVLRTRVHGRLTARLCIDGLLKGLLLAERELQRMPGDWIDYADLIRNEEVLRKFLTSMYPGVDFTGVHYIDDSFVARRERVQRSLSPGRRSQLAERLERLRATL